MIICGIDKLVGSSRIVQRARATALRCAIFALITPLFMPTAQAHPHVFVDGGVDFVMREGAVLEALTVTWLYDEFETLYILSSHGLSLNEHGLLDERDRNELVRQRSKWPEDFDGSAHLTIDGVKIALDWPAGLNANLKDGRLELTFTRSLSEPIPILGKDVTVDFYESTYFFAFSITTPPQISALSEECVVDVIPFDPSIQTNELRAALARLGREDRPGIPNVGALFADRIALQCG